MNIFTLIILGICLILIVLCLIGGIILNYITRVEDVLAENQQKLADNQKIISKRIDRKHNESKENSKFND